MKLTVNKAVPFCDLPNDREVVFLMQLPRTDKWVLCTRRSSMKVFILAQALQHTLKDHRKEDHELVSLREGGFVDFYLTIKPDTLVIPVHFPTYEELGLPMPDVDEETGFVFHHCKSNRQFVAVALDE